MTRMRSLRGAKGSLGHYRDCNLVVRLITMMYS
jgi:hypothetical protein